MQYDFAIQLSHDEKVVLTSEASVKRLLSTICAERDASIASCIERILAFMNDLFQKPFQIARFAEARSPSSGGIRE